MVRAHGLAWWVRSGAMVSVAAVVGCSSPGGRVVDTEMNSGEYGQARSKLSNGLTTNRKDRNYVLDRISLSVATLADGQPELAEPTVNEAYEILRTAGVNKDGTLKTFFGTESEAILWKGEPFEQACTYAYISIQRAMSDRWDESLIAAKESLFLLKDFGTNEKGERRSTEDIAKDAVAKEQGDASKKDAGSTKDSASKKDDYFETEYKPTETNFTLGYVLAGVAATAESKKDEAAGYFARAVKLNPGLEPVLKSIASGACNTVFVVDCGLGPKKVAYGADDAFSKFDPRQGTGWEPIVVSVNNGARQEAPVAMDINLMAADHTWNNMQDVRVAKSTLGTGLLAAGAGTAIAGAAVGGDTGGYMALAGLGMMLAGALAKASAAADTRYCYYLPQRTYIAAVNIVQPESTVHLSVDRMPNWTMNAVGLQPPTRENPIQLRYVRFADMNHLPGATMPAPVWASSTTICYAADDFKGRIPGDDVPWILGGTSVRTPTAATLAFYQSNGKLTDTTLAELQSLYQEEGIVWETQDAIAAQSRAEKPVQAASFTHVLEGGNSLIAPKAGTAGYTRLFAQKHPAYAPKSERAKQLAQQYAQASSAPQEHP